MRVLYLAPWFPYPLDTGSRSRIHHLLQGLAKRHRVTLLALDPQGWAPAQSEGIAHLCEEAAIIRRDPFRRPRLRQATRFFSMRPVVGDPFPEMLNLARARHSEEPFDVVICGTTVMARYADAIAGAAHVLEEHNSATRWMRERYQAQTRLVSRLRCLASWRKSAWYESSLLPRFDLITMVSEQDKEVAQGLLRQERPPVQVLPNGVDCRRFHPGAAAPEPDTIVFSGALTYQANYEAMAFFLSQVYPLIRAQRPAVRLRITGSSGAASLERLCLDDSVTLTGFVEDVRPEIARAWVAVAPILTGGGTRIKILEAMALGTPVVTTTKGAEGLEIIAGPGGHALTADMPEAFAQCVLDLLASRPLRERLADQARRLVEERYDWEAIGDRFANLVEAAAGTRMGALP